MSVRKSGFEELLKGVEILVKSKLGYEARHCGPSKERLLQTVVGGGNIVIAGTRQSTASSNANSLDGLERLNVVGAGVATFTKLIANGVFPGFGGYELTDDGKQFKISTVSADAILPNTLQDTSGLTSKERAFLINAAKEVGVVIPIIASPQKPIIKAVTHAHEDHQPIIPENYELNVESGTDEATGASNAMAKSKERRVPSSRFARLANFGALAMSLGSGAAAEVTRRTFGVNKIELGSNTNPFMTTANVERIVATLCRVRGAALKIGQMLSIQDEEIMPAYLLQIFERVRQSADFMPVRQVHEQLELNLGVNWREKFLDFEEKPFAAASIGQVHKATALDGRKLAVKIQYPGVADSIDSDINNLVSVLKFGNFFPKGAYLDNFVVVARRELKDECDYEREARAMRKFRELVADLPEFYVPKVFQDLSTKQVLAGEYVVGKPVDRCINEPQGIRDFLSRSFIELCLREIFTWQFMQTDPNWSNFLLGKHPKTNRPCLTLLDFGSSRSYPKIFVDRYMNIIRSAYDGHEENVLKYSREIGFLTGYESKVMEKAHCESIMVLAELLTTQKPYDFSAQNVTKRIHKLIPVMLEHRLTSPPEEIYSLHRKLAGCYLVATKLKAVVSCGALFQEIYKQYEFGEEKGANIDIDAPNSL